MSLVEFLVVAVLALCALAALLTRLDGSIARYPVRNPLSAFWRRAMEDNGRLRLAEVAAGQGLGPLADAVSAAALRKAAMAARRCVFCPEHARCDQLLACRGWVALRRICPNTSYLDRLAQASR